MRMLFEVAAGVPLLMLCTVEMMPWLLVDFFTCNLLALSLSLFSLSVPIFYWCMITMDPKISCFVIVDAPCSLLFLISFPLFLVEREGGRHSYVVKIW